MWRFKHNYFSFDPLYGEFDVAGIQYEWDDGIFSITLGRRQPDGYRLAYFHAMVRFVVPPHSISTNRTQVTIIPRNLFNFHPFSTSEFAVSTKVLQNEQSTSRTDFQVCWCSKYTELNLLFDIDSFQFLGMRGDEGQSATHEIDPQTGIIFYSQVQRNAIGCWNPNTPHTPDNFHILAQNNETMIYPSDVTVSILLSILLSDSFWW